MSRIEACVLGLCCLGAVACGASDPLQNGGSGASAGSTSSHAGTGGNGGSGMALGTELRIDVARDAPTLVRLADASVLPLDEETRASSAWDLAFQGWDVFTNGGVSGSGQGAAFGPLSFTYFVAGEDPTDVPFLIEDKAAGAFRDWYLYDGEWHTLYSRFHSYGVKRGERTFKLQVQGYYGEVQGAPISALYQLRYAELTPAGGSELVQLTNLDATAGGLSVGDVESTCLSLASGEQTRLSAAALLESSDWDLCFRRDAISVNGGLGGPGGVTAVDLNADQSATETLATVKARTSQSEAAAFEALDYAALDEPGLAYHGDRVVSAFTDKWVDRASSPARLPDTEAWLVLSADGTSRFLIEFVELVNSTNDAAGTLVLRLRQVR